MTNLAFSAYTRAICSWLEVCQVNSFDDDMLHNSYKNRDKFIPDVQNNHIRYVTRHSDIGMNIFNLFLQM